MKSEDIALSVPFEDRHLIVIDSPAGLVVDPGAGHSGGTLVNALLHHCKDLSGIGGELRPGIVHRLDKDTSGVLVVAKDDQTHAALSALFKSKNLVRGYLAIVAPAPRLDSGRIDTRYGRHPTDRKRFTSRLDAGKRAVTNYKVLERFGEAAALLECRLETGRTHQIRVHMAESGHPVVGDKTYGRRPKDERVVACVEGLSRQALHATQLEFRHPATDELVSAKTPLPDDMQAVLKALRWTFGGDIGLAGTRRAT